MALADRLGVYNMLLPAILASAVLLFALFGAADTGGVVAVAALFGFSSGACTYKCCTLVFASMKLTLLFPDVEPTAVALLTVRALHCRRVAHSSAARDPVHGPQRARVRASSTSWSQVLMSALSFIPPFVHALCPSPRRPRASRTSGRSGYTRGLVNAVGGAGCGWASRSRSWARPCSSARPCSGRYWTARPRPAPASGGAPSSSPGCVLFLPSLPAHPPSPSELLS